MFRRYIGDRSFYKSVFLITMPIIIQSGITNFVSLLDNIMVGQIGTLPMGGVSVVNQLIFVFNLCIYGATSSAGIFTAQYYGKQDHNGVRYTFRFKTVMSLLFAGLFIALFTLCPDTFIRLYLSGDGTAEDIAATLHYARQYLKIMLWGLVPFAVSGSYSGTLRECGETTVPMAAGTVAVFVNLIFNYILIFGHFGAPALGAEGAAIATVLSRYVEVGILIVWTAAHKKEHPFIVGAFRGIYIPVKLLARFIRKSIPLTSNEILWALAISFLNQCYSTCSLDVMNAVNISGTIMNITNVATQSLGITIGIMMGQLMGAGCGRDEIIDKNRKLIALSVFCGFVLGLAQAAVSGIFPKIYNTTDSIKLLASQMILITGLWKPVSTAMYAAYYTVRSGGKALTTFLYDSGIVWVLTIPLAFCLSRFTDIKILPLFIVCQLPDLVKTTIGMVLVRRRKWIQNITV